jgi:hypothetical protein
MLPMPTMLPIRRKRRGFFSARGVFYLVCIGVAVAALHASFRDQYGELFAPFMTGPAAVNLPTAMRPGAPDGAKLPTVVKLGGGPPSRPEGKPTGALDGSGLPSVIKLGPDRTEAPTGSLYPNFLEIVDGDTVRVDGRSYRLAGIDAPESGTRAKCAVERELAARTKSRLREILSGGGVKLDRVSCGCPAGTEGTEQCNYGRLCAVLTVAGSDVGRILIGEGLARRYDCAGSNCPPKQRWCS